MQSQDVRGYILRKQQSLFIVCQLCELWREWFLQLQHSALFEMTLVSCMPIGWRFKVGWTHWSLGEISNIWHLKCRFNYIISSSLWLIMRHWSWSALITEMACRPFGAKPLPEPMMVYHQLIWITFKRNSEFEDIHCRTFYGNYPQQISDHFVQGLGLNSLAYPLKSCTVRCVSPYTRTEIPCLETRNKHVDTLFCHVRITFIPLSISYVISACTRQMVDSLCDTPCSYNTINKHMTIYMTNWGTTKSKYYSN